MLSNRILRFRAVTGPAVRMLSTKAFVPNPKDFQKVLESMASPCREMGDRLEVCGVLCTKYGTRLDHGLVFSLTLMGFA